MKRPRRRPARWRPASMRGRLTLIATIAALVPLSTGAVVAAVSMRGYLLKEAHDYATVTTGIADIDTAREAAADPARVPERLRGDPRLEIQVRTAQEVPSLPGLQGREPALVTMVRQVGPASLSLWPWTDPAGRSPVLESFLRRGSGPSGPVLFVFSPLRYEQARLNTVVWSLTGAVTLTTALVAAATWFAAGRVLRPVEAIRSRFADLTAHHLDRRVPVPGTDDEVARLARTMNSTLHRLEANVDRQSRFVADASHELRSPLAALRAELEIALAHPDRADWRDVVDGALGDTRRLQRLTTDLLLLARLDASGSAGPAGGGSVDLAALVRDETGRRRVPEHLALRVEAAPGPVPLHGHHALLARLLGNLLDNAERHAVQVIEVRLTHDAVARRAVVCVQDDGPGIPPADRRRVFERFTRLDDARTRDTGGTGLGLAIAHRIAGAHHGTLEIADSAHGARFTITLPTGSPAPAPVRSGA
ncbi:HAMP domain-containing sensor histidine kinase [Streptomyces sp. NPDC026206]|uniref:sensor histidine kinase n=1 Tax=Streptomyces sp. NPDC026206 TaxID=3157089 RepID=UPI0033D832D2